MPAEGGMLGPMGCARHYDIHVYVPRTIGFPPSVVKETTEVCPHTFICRTILGLPCSVWPLGRCCHFYD